MSRRKKFISAALAFILFVAVIIYACGLHTPEELEATPIKQTLLALLAAVALVAAPYFLCRALIRPSTPHHRRPPF